MTRFSRLLAIAVTTLMVIIHVPLKAQWKQCGGLIGGGINALLVHDSILFAGTHGGIFVSRDAGSTWMPANDGMIETPHAIVTYGLAHQDSTVFAATAAGLFRSMNGGEKWSIINNGLPTGSASAVAADSSNIVTAIGSRIF